MALCPLSSSWDLSPKVWIRTLPSLTPSNSRIVLRPQRVNGRTKLYVFDTTLCQPDQGSAHEDVKDSNLNGNYVNYVNGNDLIDNELIESDLTDSDLKHNDLNAGDVTIPTITDLRGLYTLFLSCTGASPALHHRFYSHLTFAFYSFRDAEVFNNSLPSTTKSFVYNITFLDQLRGSAQHIKFNLHQSLQGYANLQILTLEQCDWLGDVGRYQCWKEDFLMMLMRIQYQFPQLVKVTCGKQEMNCGTFRLMAKDVEVGEDEIEFDPKDEYRELMDTMWVRRKWFHYA